MNINKIIDRINNLNDLDDSTIENITNDIHNIKDESIRNNIYRTFLNRVKNYMIVFFDNYSAEDINKKVNTVINNLTSSLHFDEQLLKDTKFSTDEIIGSNIFNKDDEIIDEKNDKDKYIDYINNINDLDPELCADIIVEIENNFDGYDKEEIINSLEKKYETLLNNETYLKDKEEKERIKKEFYKNVDNYYYTLTNPDNFEEEIDNTNEENNMREIDKINNITEEIYSKLDTNVVKNEFYKLTEKELEDKLYELTQERIKDTNKDMYDDLDNKISNVYSLINERRLLDKYNHLTNEELEDLIKNTKIIINKYEKYSIDKLNEIIKQNEKKLIDNNDFKNAFNKTVNEKYSKLNQEQIDSVEEKIKNNIVKHNNRINLENELIKEIINNKNNIDIFSNLSDKIEEELIKVLNLRTKDKYKYYTYDKLKEIYENDIDENSDILNELMEREKNLTSEERDLYKNLMDIKNAYYNMLDDTISKFKDTNIKGDINDYINNHELIGILNNYENSDKLKKELNEDISKSLNKKKKRIKIEKKEYNKKIWLKALAGSIGFVAGFGLSNIPGISPIGSTVAAAKLAISAVNLWTKKYPEGKVASFKNKQINNFENKCPNISKKVKVMKEKLNNDPIKWFVNGVAVGYLTGNIYEILNGETFFEQMKDLFSDGNNITDSTVAVVDPVVPDIPEIDPSEIFLNKGEIVNISELPKGYISSDAKNAVNVMQKVGEAVEFDKAVTLPDGKVMWHFKQLNGKGYAWFEASKIQELLAKTAKVVSKAL